MDSLTQGLLGAVTFAVVKDKAIGKKSLLFGAVAGTIPDLDVFLAPMFNEVEFLTVHRSVSHSIFFAILLSMLLGAIFHRRYKKKHSQFQWMIAFFLSIFTHSILDWCTTYGTKLLSPFNGHIFSTNNIHVFDPCYTIILLVGTIVLLYKKSFQIERKKIIQWTLILSSCYLVWTFVSKKIANNQFKTALAAQDIAYDKLIVSPTPFNSVLWHGIAKTKDGYYISTYSMFDQQGGIKFQYEQSDNEVISRIEGNRLVAYYLDYTQDFPLIRIDAVGDIEIFAIKYGPVNYFGAPEFVFPLTLNESSMTDDHIKIDHSGSGKTPVKSYRKLWERIKGI